MSRKGGETWGHPAGSCSGIGTNHNLIAQVSYGWHNPFLHCNASGWDFEGMTEIETRLSLLAAVLTSCTDAYKENVRIASLLEDKAQKTGAFAGLFIAAAFGFAKRDNIHDVIALAGNIGILVMILCLLFFLACVFQCLRVMWVQSTVGPVNPEQLFAITNALLNLKEPLLGEKTENHSRDQIHGWIGILRRQQGLNGVKAARLLRAQWILAIGMMMLGVLLILLTTHVTKGK